jgi:hypothetical protein
MADHRSNAIVSPRFLNSKGMESNNTQRRLTPSSEHSQTSAISVLKLNEDEVGKKRICGMFRRRSKTQSFSTVDEFVMKRQISKLREMMKSSLATSEKLRRRIETITKYYEGIISKLQSKVVEVKTEKSRTEVDLRNELSRADFERRMIVSKLEFELRRKDEEISILKREKRLSRP